MFWLSFMLVYVLEYGNFCNLNSSSTRDKYLHYESHFTFLPASGDIIRDLLKDDILSAVGVSAAANDTGGDGGTRPSFYQTENMLG